MRYKHHFRLIYHKIKSGELENFTVKSTNQETQDQKNHLNLAADQPIFKYELHFIISKFS